MKPFLDLTDEEWDEHMRQEAEEFAGRSANNRASAAARRSEVSVLKAQVTGLLEEPAIAIAPDRIEQLETAAIRRLDRLDAMVDAMAKPTGSDGASSTCAAGS